MDPKEHGPPAGSLQRFFRQMFLIILLTVVIVHMFRVQDDVIATDKLVAGTGLEGVEAEVRAPARDPVPFDSINSSPGSADCVRSLKQAIMETIGHVIGCRGHSGGTPKPSRVLYMDPALHDNIGDNLINKGEKILLEDCALTDDVGKIVCCVEKLCREKRIYPECTHENLMKWGWHEGPHGRGVMLYHGGGNWGDLYAWIQRSRMDTLLMVGTNFPSSQFVSLPQSFFYKNAEKRDNDAREINEALKLFKTPPVFLWRDRPSLAMAEKLYRGCKNMLIPDIVFMINPLVPTLEAPPLDVLISMRKEESVKGFSGNKKMVEDIMETLPKATYWTVRGWEEAYLVTRDQRFDKARSTKYDWDFCVKIASNFLSQAHSVIGDKLHITITAMLLGKPMYFVDNMYNKTSNVLDAAFSFAPETCGSFTGKPEHAPSFDVAVEKWANEYRRSALDE